MEKFTATANIVIRCNFIANNPEHARKIASAEIWNSFDEIECQSNGEIELSRVDTIICVEDFEE